MEYSDRHQDPSDCFRQRQRSLVPTFQNRGSRLEYIFRMLYNTWCVNISYSRIILQTNNFNIRMILQLSSSFPDIIWQAAPQCRALNFLYWASREASSWGESPLWTSRPSSSYWKEKLEHTKNVPSLPDSVEDGNSVVWHLDLLQIDEDGEGLVRWVVEVLAKLADNFNSKSGQHIQGREWSQCCCGGLRPPRPCQ